MNTFGYILYYIGALTVSVAVAYVVVILPVRLANRFEELKQENKELKRRLRDL